MAFKYATMSEFGVRYSSLRIPSTEVSAQALPTGQRNRPRRQGTRRIGTAASEGLALHHPRPMGIEASRQVLGAALQLFGAG